MLRLIAFLRRIPPRSKDWRPHHVGGWARVRTISGDCVECSWVMRRWTGAVWEYRHLSPAEWVDLKDEQDFMAW